MTENGGSATTILGELQGMAARMNEEIARLEAQKAKIDADLRRLRALTRVFEPETPKPTRRRAGQAKMTFAAPSVAQIASEILKRGDESFSAIEIGRAVGVSDPTTYSAISLLRDRELIGKAGALPGDGEGHNKRTAYRILDKEGLLNVAT